jgi:hypothetical protein
LPQQQATRHPEGNKEDDEKSKKNSRKAAKADVGGALASGAKDDNRRSCDR